MYYNIVKKSSVNYDLNLALTLANFFVDCCVSPASLLQNQFYLVNLMFFQLVRESYRLTYFLQMFALPYHKKQMVNIAGQ